MARYIKANPKVAQFLRLENDRNQVKDGNYMLWQNDMLAFGRLTDLPQILPQIGAVSLAAHEAREEQDGTVVRELPIATDPRFVVEKAEPVEEDPTEEAAQDPAGAEQEQPTGTEEPAEPAEEEAAAEAAESETTNEVTA